MALLYKWIAKVCIPIILDWVIKRIDEAIKTSNWALKKVVKDKAEKDNDKIDKAFSDRDESALTGLRDDRHDETKD